MRLHYLPRSRAAQRPDSHPRAGEAACQTASCACLLHSVLLHRLFIRSMCHLQALTRYMRSGVAGSLRVGLSCKHTLERYVLQPCNSLIDCDQ